GREEEGPSDARRFQKMTLKIRMKRYRNVLFCFARNKANELGVEVDGLPPHVCHVAKPCTRVVGKENRALPIAFRCLYKPRHLLCREIKTFRRLFRQAF